MSVRVISSSSPLYDYYKNNPSENVILQDSEEDEGEEEERIHGYYQEEESDEENEEVDNEEVKLEEYKDDNQDDTVRNDSSEYYDIKQLFLRKYSGDEVDLINISEYFSYYKHHRFLFLVFISLSKITILIFLWNFGLFVLGILELVIFVFLYKASHTRLMDIHERNMLSLREIKETNEKYLRVLKKAMNFVIESNLMRQGYQLGYPYPPVWRTESKEFENEGDNFSSVGIRNLVYNSICNVRKYWYSFQTEVDENTTILPNTSPPSPMTRTSISFLKRFCQDVVLLKQRKLDEFYRTCTNLSLSKSEEGREEAMEYFDRISSVEFPRLKSQLRSEYNDFFKQFHSLLIIIPRKKTLDEEDPTSTIPITRKSILRYNHERVFVHEMSTCVSKICHQMNQYHERITRLKTSTSSHETSEMEEGIMESIIQLRQKFGILAKGFKEIKELADDEDEESKDEAEKKNEEEEMEEVEGEDELNLVENNNKEKILFESGFENSGEEEEEEEGFSGGRNRMKKDSEVVCDLYVGEAPDRKDEKKEKEEEEKLERIRKERFGKPLFAFGQDQLKSIRNRRKKMKVFGDVEEEGEVEEERSKNPVDMLLQNLTNERLKEEEKRRRERLEEEQSPMIKELSVVLKVRKEKRVDIIKKTVDIE